jgi:hypothetical protein
VPKQAPASRLLEREPFLAALHDALDASAHGNGRLLLVAGEAGVGKTALMRSFVRDSGARAFGQTFNLTLSPNRFGLPAFYSLHAWIWKHNPAGMFSPWNPDVTCANA